MFKLSKLNKEPSKMRGKLNLNNLQSIFLSFYRKVNYLVSDLALQMFENLIREIKSALSGLTSQYMFNKAKY